jgi:hypothetical protein
MPKLLETIQRNAGISSYEILIEFDINGIGCPQMVNQLVSQTSGENICFLGDDTLPEKDFLKNALNAMDRMPDGWGLVALNDGSGRPQTASHFLAARKLLPHLENGELFYTGYRHGYGDNELSEIAQAMGRYCFAEDAKIKHVHPIHGTAEYDEYYERAYNNDTFLHDQQLFIKRKLARGGIHLGICLPSVNEKEYSTFWLSVLRMNKPSYYTLLMPRHRRGDMCDIVSIRNELVRQALDWRLNCTHILMMDTDQVYPSGTFSRLFSHNKPFVGTVVHRRYPPYDPCVRHDPEGNGDEKNHKFPPNNVYSGNLEIMDMTGAGCFLIQTPELFKMEYESGKWFRTIHRKNGSIVGEDYEFCRRYRKNGGTVYVDTALQIGHITTVLVDRTYHEVFKSVHSLEV